MLSSVQRSFADHSTAADGEFVLAAGRLTPEKGFADVVEACATAGLPLVVAGDGPQRAELEARAAALARGGEGAGGDGAARGGEGASGAAQGGEGAPSGFSARFVGHLPADELAALRRRAAVAVVPSRYAEILPLAALEAMAAGLPTVAARSGGLVEAVPEEGLYPTGDVAALATRLAARYRDAAAGERALAAARARSSPDVIAHALREIYGRNFTATARF